MNYDDIFHLPLVQMLASRSRSWTERISTPAQSRSEFAAPATCLPTPRSSHDDARTSTLSTPCQQRATSRDDPEIPITPHLPNSASEAIIPAGTPHTPPLTPTTEQPLGAGSQEARIPLETFLKIKAFYQGESSSETILDLDSMTDEMVKELDDMERDGRLSRRGIRCVHLF